MPHATSSAPKKHSKWLIEILINPQTNQQVRQQLHQALLKKLKMQAIHYIISVPKRQHHHTNHKETTTYT